MRIGSSVGLAALVLCGCVPPGSAGPPDSGPAVQGPAARPLEAPAAAMAPTAVPPSADVMKTPFEDDFDHAGPPVALPGAEGAPASAIAYEPSADWIPTAPGIWHVEQGRLCGGQAKNHGIWLKRVLPVNARIEFDAISTSTDGDLKAEYWGDGRSYATTLSYTNATSYLTIFGGWHNKFHVLARINEHGNDRKEITVDPNSDDPREKPVVAGQIYHFKVERTDGKTVKWLVDGVEMLSYADAQPLTGPGHDHFGFNDWDVRVCFDNVKVVPLP
jgi:hypothetical protein